MEPSPYAPGSLPEYLAGRGRERDLIRDNVSRLSMLGRSGGPLLAFHAPRGLGKTSLLRMAQRDAIDDGFLTVWVTGRDDRPMSPDLAQGLSVAVKERSFGERSKALLHRLDQVQVEFGIPGVKVGATLSGDDKAAPGSAVLEELLEDAGRFARNHDAKGLVVFVDEFQEAQLGDRKSLLIGLQHFDGAPEATPVAIVAAGLPSLPPAVTEAATFGERSRFVELGLLSDWSEKLTQRREALDKEHSERIERLKDAEQDLELARIGLSKERAALERRAAEIDAARSVLDEDESAFESEREQIVARARRAADLDGTGRRPHRAGARADRAGGRGRQADPPGALAQ